MMDWVVSWFLLLCGAVYAGYRFLLAIVEEDERRHAISEWAWEKEEEHW